MKRLAILLVAVVLLGAEKKDNLGKKDLAAMQGDWAADKMVRDGMAFPDDDARALFRTIKGDAYTVFRFRKKIGSGTFKLDATKTPRHIDFVPAGVPKGVVILGIYKMENDTM